MMDTQQTATDGTTAYSRQNSDAANASFSLRSFLNGERSWLWPVWLLAGIMLLVILWDRFVAF